MSNCIANGDLEACKKIKEHLERNKNKFTDVTPSLMGHWWKRLNNAVFDGTLRHPKKFETVQWKLDSGGMIQYGDCCPHYDKDQIPYVNIRLRPRFRTKEEFMSTLIHEMVHQYQWEINKVELDHGDTFTIWEPKIKELLGFSHI